MYQYEVDKYVTDDKYVAAKYSNKCHIGSYKSSQEKILNYQWSTKIYLEFLFNIYQVRAFLS